MKRTSAPLLPIATAIVIALGGYLGLVQPRLAAVAQTRAAMAATRAQVASLRSALAQAALVPHAAAPATEERVRRLWPEVVARAVAEGYTLGSISFTTSPLAVQGTLSGPDVHPAQPAPASRPTHSPVAAMSLDRAAESFEITLALTGPYLALDETLAQMAQMMPLWVWRSIRISADPQAGSTTITITGAVPVEPPGRIARTSPPATPPPGGGPAGSPPVTPPGQLMPPAHLPPPPTPSREGPFR